MLRNAIFRGSSSLMKNGGNRKIITTTFMKHNNNVSAATSRMMMIRMKSYYTPAHEYATIDGEDCSKVKVGITDFAQSALGDIVFVDLPEVGEEYEKGDAFGSVESVKAASDVYCPVSGTVSAINDALVDNPEMVNSAAETDAWFIELNVEGTAKEEFDDLMDTEAYATHCENEAD